MMSIEAINVPRLFTDLVLTEADLQLIAGLDIPEAIGVPSVSPIKTITVSDALTIAHPYQPHEVFGVKAPSGVPEQPLGWQAVEGSLNRIQNAMSTHEEADDVGWVSIENGLFRVAMLGGQASPDTMAATESINDTALFAAGADLSVEYDPSAEYADRAVAAIKLPGWPTVVQISPVSEAVVFPRAAVQAAFGAPGSFGEHTVGSKLVDMGLVTDKQNPHFELSAHRPGGPLPRQDQMARAIIRSFVQLTRL